VYDANFTTLQFTVEYYIQRNEVSFFVVLTHQCNFKTNNIHSVANLEL